MLIALILACYAAAAHVAAISGNPYPAIVALGALLACSLWPSLRRGQPAAWLGLVAAFAGLMFLLWSERLLQLLYMPPIVMNLGLSLMFGRTLRAGETPLVTRIALAMGDPASAPLLAYTRGVTLAWTLFFIAMAIESLLLACFASPAVWSLFTNGLNYIFVAALFPLEYAARRRLLGLPDQGGFFGFLRSLQRAGFKRLAKGAPPA